MKTVKKKEHKQYKYETYQNYTYMHISYFLETGNYDKIVFIVFEIIICWINHLLNFKEHFKAKDIEYAITVLKKYPWKKIMLLEYHCSHYQNTWNLEHSSLVHITLNICIHATNICLIQKLVFSKTRGVLILLREFSRNKTR